MKHIFWISCLTALSMHAGNAQDSTIALRRSYRAVIKLAPLSLLDPDATVQAGLEYRTGVSTSVQGEFGYGGKGLYFSQNDLKSFLKAEVWRGRAEVRFYTNRYRTNRRRDIAIRSTVPLGNYWAIEGLYKRINVLKQENVYTPDPYKLIGTNQVPISRYVLGSHLKIGRQFAFYDPYRRVFSRTLIDIYIGAGVRWARNDVPLPTPQPVYGCSCVTSFGSSLFRSFDTTETKVSLSITAGLKFGFAL